MALQLDFAQEIYDISPVINSELAVFPGDVPFSQETALDQKKGDHLYLSSIRTTLHIGAHADAPLHYGTGEESIETRSLRPYMGECQVVEVTACPLGQRITLDDFNIEQIQAPRVLFKTKSFYPYKWESSFNSLSPEVIEALVEQKSLVLIGLDTPSVDPHDSKNLESHNCLLKHNLSVLEGLDLEEVPEGIYQLIALPLRIQGGDASPVRAILLR